MTVDLREIADRLEKRVRELTMTTESRDIIERLDNWIAWVADEVPAPQGGELGADLREAIATIKGYRSVAGGASPGPSFAEITKDIPRRSTEPNDPK